MAKTQTVMTVSPDYDGYYYVVIRDSTAKANPYKVYRRWYDCGWHRKKMVEYANFESVLFYLLQLKYKKVYWDVTEEEEE